MSENYEVTYSGPYLPDYFQGAGTCFTPWHDVAVGSGSTVRDAYEDAWDFAAQGTAPLPDFPPFEDSGLPDEAVPEEYEDSLFFVVIRYNRVKE